jgi:uncharacterized delta-60 repeat protein
MNRLATLLFLLGCTTFQITPLHAQPGQLDDQFGQGGTVILPFTIGGQSYSSVAQAAVGQADGKVLVAGSYDLIDPWASDAHFLLRLGADGTPDQGFGQAGWLLTPTGQNMLPPHLQSDGSLLLVGSGPDTTLPNQVNVLLRRYLADGQPDLNFGDQGLMTLPLGNQKASLAQLYVRADGALMLLGFDGNRNLKLFNLSEQQSGLGTSSFSTASQPAIDNLRVEAVQPQPDGKILVAGTTLATTVNPNGNIVVFRLNQDLSLDQSFGEGGIAEVDLSPSPQMVVIERLSELALQADGRILMVGSQKSHTNRISMLVVRLTATGQPDVSFGDQGSVYVPLHQPLFPVAQAEGTAQQVAIQADGNILITGKWGPYQNAWPTVILRLRPNGSLDPSFGQQGVTLGSQDSLPVQEAKLVMQPDGHILLVGAAASSQGYDLAISRVMTAEPEQTTHLRQVPTAVNELAIYPNPVSEAPFHLNYDLRSQQSVSAYVLNLQGQRVATLMEHAPRSAGAQAETLQLTQSLSSGHYLVQVVTDQGSQTTRMIKR